MKCSHLQASFKARLTRLTEVGSAIVALCVLPSFLLAQVNQARLIGTVTDQSGDVIAGATVTVTDVQKNVSRTLATDMAGEYVAPNLDPDTYSVRVEAKGFRTFTGEGMQLGVGRDARADVTLQPGEQTQAITVTEALPLIETTTATLTSTVDNPTVSEIPLNGRNYINLLTLRPGSSRPLHRATPVACSLSNTIRFSALPRRFVEIRSNKNLFARKKMRNRSPLEVIQLPEELVRTTVSRWNGVLVRDGP